MPIDQSTEPATATTRRAFLARTAGVGALVTAGALASPLGQVLPTAGAQEGTADGLTDAAFAEFATPLELAAVQAYQAALDSGVLDTQGTTWAQQFQRNHQEVVDTLTPLVAEDATAPVANEAMVTQASEAIAAAESSEDVLLALTQIESTLAATHLQAIATLDEASTAKVVTQVLAVENQQAALLAVGSGAAIGDVTPSVADTEGALSPGDAANETDTTSTTTTVPVSTTTTAAN